MQKLFVDTSAWFAFSYVKDPDHIRVMEFLKEFHGDILTSNFVLDELVTLVLTRAGHTPAVKIGNYLRDPAVVSLISVTQEDEEKSWDFLQKMKDKTYSFTDCTSFILMKRFHLTNVLSLDAHFEQAGFQKVPD
jgi:predicted nucleic acid-binding protein